MTTEAGERKPRGDEALSGTGRHLTAEELYTWTRFLDAGRLVEEMLSRHLADEHAMTHLDYEVLVRVDGAGGWMRLTTLAEYCVSSKSRLTHAINRLEERGWIRRRPVEGDGRGVAAELTAAGRAELAASAIGHAELIRRHLLEVLTPAEVPVIGGAMDRVSKHLRARRRVDG